MEEIESNDYNLNIPRYVDTFEKEEIINIPQIKETIAQQKAESEKIDTEIAAFLKELGL